MSPFLSRDASSPSSFLLTSINNFKRVFISEEITHYHFVAAQFVFHSFRLLKIYTNFVGAQLSDIY